MLATEPDIEVVGEAADAEDLLAQIEAACPDLVLLSWGLPGLAGADLLPALRSVCDDLYVIVLSGRGVASLGSCPQRGTLTMMVSRTGAANPGLCSRSQAG